MFESAITAAHPGSENKKCWFHIIYVLKSANLTKFVQISIMGGFKDLLDRKKDGDRARQRSFLRYAIVLTLLLVLFLFLKTDNVIRWIEAGVTIHRQEKQIEYYRNEIERLDKEAAMLVSDRDSLEKFARENYDFAKDGEDVYIVE